MQIAAIQHQLTSLGSNKPATDPASKQHQPRFHLYQLKALMAGVVLNSAAALCPLGCFSIQAGNPAKPTQAQPLHFVPFHACLCIGSISLQPLSITASLSFSAWMLIEAIPNILSIGAIAKILARDLLNLVLHFFFLRLYCTSKLILFFEAHPCGIGDSFLVGQCSSLSHLYMVFKPCHLPI